ERYSSAQELAEDLRHFQEHRPIRAQRPTLWQRTAKWARRHRTLLVVAVASALLAQGVTVGVLLFKNAEVSREEEATKLALGEAEIANRRLEVALGAATEAQQKAHAEEERAKTALAGEKQAREQVQEQKERAEKALALAEKHFNRARDVVDRMVMHV